jgi:hypothetical protein
MDFANVHVAFYLTKVIIAFKFQVLITSCNRGKKLSILNFVRECKHGVCFLAPIKKGVKTPGWNQKKEQLMHIGTKLMHG